MADIAMTVALAKKLGSGGGSGGVSDVQINGTSVVTDGVANVPVATTSAPGVAIVGAGLQIINDKLYTNPAAEVYGKLGNAENLPVTSKYQHLSTFYGLAKAAGADMASLSNTSVGTYPEQQKSAISQMLSAPETVSGSTPSITAKPGVQYICGEVSTIDITVPESGIIDVIFESGSTPAVLTVTPPTGKNMKWAGGFDPTSLEANTVYKINIAVAGSYCLGTATSWA